MSQEDKELLLKDLSARLPYNVIVDYDYNAFDVHNGNYVKHGSKCILNCYLLEVFISPRQNEKGEYIKPYLRSLSFMTEKEAKEIATLHGLKNILSVKITDEYIDVIIDDGVSSIKRITLWYDELVTSIECFDWLNKYYFDYRGLIPKGLAIAVNKSNNPYKV